MRKEFEQVQFRDAAQIERTIKWLVGERRPHLADHLAQALAEAADPDTALVRLQRYLDASPGPNNALDLMDAAPRFAQMLVTVLDQSHYLTDIVCRNPEYVFWLWEEVDLDTARSRDDLLDELSRQEAVFPGFEARCEALRRFKRREILRIATRDIYAHVSVESLTQDLSNLAEATLEAALSGALPELLERYGRPEMDLPDGEEAPPGCGFVILGLGKLGGCELNFSSDIDLIFLCARDGETAGGDWRPVTNAEFYQKLGQRIIKAISETTSEGRIFRVDMRLRPDGRAAHLAISLDRALHYYEASGQAWERQALIKARPVAGDLALGEAFLEQTRPYVFPRYFDDETLEDIRGMKTQSEARTHGRGETETEVKLGRGGIRDIEFTVQMLQLLNAGRFPELRVRGTLDAITVLGTLGLLRPLEAETLRSSYTFLRQVEHRLQIEGSQQRHALPSDPKAIDLFARRLGYPSGESFMRDYRERAEETRHVLERFLESEGGGHRWLTDLFNPNSNAEGPLARLKELGFSSPQKAREELMGLYAGPREHPNTLHVRQQFIAIVPALIESLCACADPDNALVRLSQVLAGLRAPGSIYDILKSSPQLSAHLVSLIINSEFLTQYLIRDPGLFDVIAASSSLDEPQSREALEHTLDILSQAREPEASLYRFHQGETLRIGMRDLQGRAEVLQVGQELALLAEVCLAHALDEARRQIAERHGFTDAGFAVLGLGKLGGGELGYGSDLDIVFVYDGEAVIDSGMAPTEYFAAVGSATLRTLKEPTKYGLLYDVDVRLRPDGKKGVLAVNVDRLADYYSREAMAWERLVLVKARTVAGDADFGQRVEGIVRDLAFAHPLSKDDLESIENVRAKIVAAASPADLKKGEGGIAELEFIVRMLQLRHVQDTPELRRADVCGAIDAIAAGGYLSQKDAGFLTDTYLLLRRVENRIRIMNGRSGSTLPDGLEAIADLAERLGFEGDLAGHIAEAREKVHGLYQETQKALMAEA
jgi:[glutamine synthetase] adenylyltransferase / [glutamine synthetase]-adenylyl-L-tyrosine phosphorylase